MKKIYCFFTMFLLSAAALFAQDTIAAWTFPSASADSMVDVSIPLNSARYLSCQYGTWASPGYHGITSYYILTGYEGGTDKCASSAGWDNGADSTYWMIKFKTTGYQNLQLSSKQSSNSMLPGPRDFKVQYKLPGSSSPWVDITGGTIVVAADWTSGVLNNVTLPAACDNQSGQIAIRWLQISDTDINGGTVAATGVSMLDDIVITGSAGTGYREIIQKPALNIYPNPCSGLLSFVNAEPGSEVMIFDQNGKCVLSEKEMMVASVDISNFAPGIYCVKVTGNSDEVSVFKLSVK